MVVSHNGDPQLLDVTTASGVSVPGLRGFDGTSVPLVTLRMA